jgi:hypothetical protein
MGARFRELMNGSEPLTFASACDVLTARVIEVHGFKGVFVGSSPSRPPSTTVCDCLWPDAPTIMLEPQPRKSFLQLILGALTLRRRSRA